LERGRAGLELSYAGLISSVIFNMRL
jgi:hypothetical protein